MPIVNLPTTLPHLGWIRSHLREVGLRRFSVLSAAIVGSYARGTATGNSDLDIAVILPYSGRISSLKRSELYHARFKDNRHLPHWQGLRVDIQFFYPDDAELKSYSMIGLTEKKTR